VRTWKVAVALVAALASGCTAVAYSIGVPLLYREAPLAEDRIVRDLAYAEDDPDKHRLDLFRAEGTGWPLLVFVHGGGWTSGDKGLRIAGADVYGNIGRFYAARGIGVAVVNYRLQPGVAWPEQVADVARAIAWLHGNVARFGGDPERLVVAGHSAGAQLAARVALDPGPLAALGADRRVVKGIVSVSGAALDLTDDEAWRLGQPRGYYETRFRNGDAGDAWMRAASPLAFVSGDAPPTLVIFAEGDPPDLRRQGRVLAAAMASAGVAIETVVVPGSSHTRIVLTLSREDTVAANAILRFVGRLAPDAAVAATN
jgi:acetyl esterase/lipase